MRRRVHRSARLWSRFGTGEVDLFRDPDGLLFEGGVLGGGAANCALRDLTDQRMTNRDSAWPWFVPSADNIKTSAPEKGSDKICTVFTKM
jgi:hypothetical protein